MPRSTISSCSARTARPTYMLAVVVDDHDMGVTHVIRGDDHLNNAFRQLAIIRAMGWPEPVYGHVPLIHGAGRGQAFQAPRRARRRRLSRRARHPARGAVQLSAPARLGPWRRRDHQPRATRSPGSISTMSAARPRASTSRSSRTSTAIICARPIRARLARRWSRRRSAGARRRDAARPGDAGADAAGEGSERARRGRGLPVHARARWTWTRRRRCC